MYIDITANTSHSSTPSLRIAQLITSLGTLSKAFSKSKKKPKQSFLPLTINFSSYICLAIKMASVVPLPCMNPNCMSSISICCRILCSKILSTTNANYVTLDNNVNSKPVSVIMWHCCSFKPLIADKYTCSTLTFVSRNICMY